MKKHLEEGAAGMPEHEKEKEKDKLPAAATTAATATEQTAAPAPGQPAPTPATKVPAAEEDASQYFFGEPLVGFDPSEITGTLIVIEGMDGSGRSTQIALLQEWLESEGFAVQTSGLRRSNLVGRDIDQLLAKNAVTRLTLSLMYATDFFDQVEHRILPALRAGTVVLADRFIFTRHQSRLHLRPLRDGASSSPDFLAQRSP
jgi:hypothetical protein